MASYPDKCLPANLKTVMSRRFQALSDDLLITFISIGGSNLFCYIVYSIDWNAMLHVLIHAIDPEREKDPPDRSSRGTGRFSAVGTIWFPLCLTV